jgi:radical SAM protein with 4Fe4S-binding SPASM domain
MSDLRPGYVRRVRRDEARLWNGRPPLLTWLDLELSERCNNDCLHCSVNRPAGETAARERELGTSETMALLEEAAGLGCLGVRLTGGEPLLREDFAEVYYFARRLGLRVLVFTNAALIAPPLARLFSRVPPREPLEVSVYGGSPETHDAVTRRPGSFEAACRGLALLAERRVPFLLKGALLPGTIGESSVFERWARGLTGQARVDWVQFLDLRSRRDNGSEVRNAGIRALRLPPGEVRRRTAALPEAEKCELRGFIAAHAALQGDRLFSCLEAGGKGAVDPYGVFQYCLSLRHPETVFDLRRGGLKRALTEHLPAVRAMKARDPEYLGRCGRCPLKAFCLQCPAKSWAEHGTLDTPVEYFCQVAHAQAAGLGLLEDGERAWALTDWERRIGPAPLSARGRRSEERECGS